MHFYTVKEILVLFISEFSSVAVFDTAILSVATIAPDNVSLLFSRWEMKMVSFCMAT